MILRWPTSSTAGSCGTCCLAAPCLMTLKYDDVNRCEDDAFNVYLKWKDESGDSQQRFIALLDMVSSPAGCCGTDASGNPCPETIREIPLTVALAEVGPCCEIELSLEFDHANCCNTYAVFTLTGPGGEVTSNAFDSGGLDQTFDIRDICNPAP
ncbi:hypothetical protein SAMN05444156_1588 [Verrucomicrobium sp. GAS474]|uniref:hypothetical protein n=1 Tax=Verrucomicrobium sp. GAS474 TaxID=1882831 RepID=UPI00087A3D50|nr:hypothetical protein [Verrucomicrobium sp. GAS474]SDU03682.1 hypothetical protein SAMN05444156_1588 [Verrucomicrobium sp. GAS474]